MMNTIFYAYYFALLYFFYSYNKQDTYSLYYMHKSSNAIRKE